MADDKWQGMDANLETSLFDDGFIAKQKADKDYPDEWFVLYQISPNAYGTGHIREKELDDLINGKEWMDEDKINKFLDYVGDSKESWLKSSFINKLGDLLSYWGHEEILGTDYHPLDRKGAMKMAGFDKGESRAAKFIEGASDIVKGAGTHSSDIVDDKLNTEVTLLQGVLQGKKIGKGSYFQAVSGAMINPLDLGAKNDDVGKVELPPTDGQSKASRLISKVATIGSSAAESRLTEEEEGGDGHPFKNMLKRNLRGVAKQFTGPFYGAIEPLLPNDDPKSKFSSKSFKVSKEELKVAKRMQAKGYVYAMKVKGDDRLVYFRKATDAGPYLRSTGDKPVWNGTIEDLVGE